MDGLGSPSYKSMPRRQAILESLAIFALFCVQGAWPVPEVNEPYYLGKAIHYWNPHWAAGDWFLQTADTPERAADSSSLPVRGRGSRLGPLDWSDVGFDRRSLPGPYHPLSSVSQRRPSRSSSSSAAAGPADPAG